VVVKVRSGLLALFGMVLAGAGCGGNDGPPNVAFNPGGQGGGGAGGGGGGGGGGGALDASVPDATVADAARDLSGGGADGDPAVGGPMYPSELGDRWVAMVSPTSGESFVAPAGLRLIAAAHDPNVSTNSPVPGRGGNARSVQFFVDGQQVLQVEGADAEYWIFKGTAAGVAAGQHRVWARAIYAEPALVLDSAPMLVTVAPPPAYARTVTLDADVLIQGGEGYELAGTPDARIRLEGNGHRIVSDGAPMGSLTFRYVDVVDLGSRTNGTEPAIQISTSGNVTIEDSTFDSSNTLDIAIQGSSTASIRRNVFRSNMRMALGQSPSTAGASPSYPSVRFTGPSTGNKAFSGNNVGAGWVQFDKSSKWVVGGDTDADSNVLIGPRVGIFVQESIDVIVRNNYSHHIYFGGWSQGSNVELGGSPSALVEHNVISGGSWPVRGAGCEFRYNLVADAGHQFIWPETGGSIHHNVFSGGLSDIAGIFLVGEVKGARVFNNTVDGQLVEDVVTAVSLAEGTVASLSSNLFINIPRPPGTAPGATITLAGGALMTSDYNAFANVQMNHYSDGRRPAHDLFLSGPAAAKLTDPPSSDSDWDDVALWNRSAHVRDILADWRRRYTPAAGSPLIDKGDPAGGAGNDIGAVGAGAPSGADQFGRF
jgi:hypothetical protein